MKKTYHAESVINAFWRKLTGLLPMAGLGAVIGLCLAAVFSRGGVAKAQTGEEAAGNELTGSYDQSPLVEQFFGLERTAEGRWPKWLLAVYFTSLGEWQTDPSPLAFHVPAAQEENSGVLSLQVDRASAGEDLVLALTYGNDQSKGSLFIGLSYWPEGSEANEENVIFLGDLFGNIMQGQGGTTTAYFEIPLQRFSPSYLNVDIYRGKGEIMISGAALYTRSEFNYWLEQALMQGEAGLEPAAGGAEPEESRASAPSVASDSGSRETITARRQEASAPGMMELAAEQIAAAAQVAANLMITRSVLSGGGARQRSAKFILEDTFAQPSAVGFSYGGGIMLHTGYQQADDQFLAIWNAGVMPPQFNPALGEVATLSYVLSSRSPNVSIDAVNGPITIPLATGGPQGAGLHTVIWDGQDASGNVVAATTWTNRIWAYDYQGAVVATEAVVEVVRASTMPVILDVEDAPDPFCPATNGVVAISYTTAISPTQSPMNVAITIEDALGASVTNFNFANQNVGSYVINWDGAGAQRNGLYIYRVNAWRGGRRANEQSGSIVLGCNVTCATSSDGTVRVCYQPGAFSLSVLPASPEQLSSASFALLAEPFLLFQSGVYDIQATLPTEFDPPAILTFQYDPAVSGAIGGKLELRRYDQAAASWETVANQFVDYAHNQILAEVTNLSLYALFAVERPAAPAVLAASVRLVPEVLKVSPGKLTAFVSLPEGFDPGYITDATCDGATYESMRLAANGTEMMINFTRTDIEAALTEIGEELDTYFVVRGTWQGPAGTYLFQGADTITKIVGGE